MSPPRAPAALLLALALALAAGLPSTRAESPARVVPGPPGLVGLPVEAVKAPDTCTSPVVVRCPKPPLPGGLVGSTTLDDDPALFEQLQRARLQGQAELLTPEGIVVLGERLKSPRQQLEEALGGLAEPPRPGRTQFRTWTTNDGRQCSSVVGPLGGGMQCAPRADKVNIKPFL